MKQTTPRQIAARKRNWKLAELKACIVILRGFAPSCNYQLSGIKALAEDEINRLWELEKLNIEADEQRNGTAA